MRRILSLSLALLMVIFISAGCARQEDDTLIVGMELAYPPFETKDANGDPSGVSVDFAKELGRYLGREVKIENIAWDGLIPALETGQVDLVISSMTIKEERLEKIDFSIPYAKALLALLTNKDSGIESIDDLNQAGKSVAVKNGSTGHIYAQNNLPDAEIIVLADESACVTEVIQGKADAFIYDQLTIYRNQSSNPDTTSAVYIPFQDVEYWAVGIKKGSTELTGQVNAFIKDFYARNGFAPLVDKYLADEKAAFDQMGFAWFFDDVVS